MTAQERPSPRRLPALLATTAWPSGWLASTQLGAYAWAARVAWVLFVSRLTITLAAYLGWYLLPEAVNPPPYHLRGLDNLLVDTFGSRWDTGFYVSIVEEGYIYDGVPLPSVAFFPLLPLLMRALMPLTGDAVLAGLLVSNIALLIAALLFYRIVAMQWGATVAHRAVWYLLIFPTSFFGSAIYSEALFLACALGAWYAARRGWWARAALLGVAVTATRLVGIIIVPLLLFEWFQQWRIGSYASGNHPFLPRPPLKTLMAPLAAPLGLFGYMLFLWARFGDALGFATASKAWERTPVPPAQTITALLQRPEGGWLAGLTAGQIPVNDWIDFAFLLLFLMIGFCLIYEHRWGEGLFVWLGVMVPFSSGLLMSQRRYMWILFPAFILMARWGHRPGVDLLITALSLVGLILFTALFANGYWVA